VAPLTFTPATISYGTQVVGTTSTAKIVTVKNVSASAVTLSSIASSGDFTAVGSGTKPCAAGLQLNAAASCTMSVTFSPAFGASGSVTGAIVVTDNASVGQQVLDVKGPAGLPLSFTPTSLTFAPQTGGELKHAANGHAHQQSGEFRQSDDCRQRRACRGSGRSYAVRRIARQQSHVYVHGDLYSYSQRGRNPRQRGNCQ
jgi:hypothetical protein